jgi:hypothetical protein
VRIAPIPNQQGVPAHAMNDRKNTQNARYISIIRPTSCRKSTKEKKGAIVVQRVRPIRNGNSYDITQENKKAVKPVCYTPSGKKSRNFLRHVFISKIKQTMQ